MKYLFLTLLLISSSFGAFSKEHDHEHDHDHGSSKAILFESLVVWFTKTYKKKLGYN